MDESITLRLGLQRALLGSITPDIRAVSAGFDGDAIRLRFVFAARPAAADRERCEEIATEIAADFAGKPVETEIITRLPPEAVDNPADGCLPLSFIVYKRYEE